MPGAYDSRDLGRDVLAGDWRRRRTVPEVPADRDLVVEVAADGFCGAVVGCGRDGVTLEDRRGRRRLFPLSPAGFLLDGSPVTLVRRTAPSPVEPRAGRTASGSIAVPAAPARVARASRIWVEGIHDAALLERVWGDDLRVEGVVVEPLDGVDALAAAAAAFAPGPNRRLGVLVDHLVAGSKESRVAAAVQRAHPGSVLVVGHPYVDVWQAVKPASLGIAGWPAVPRGVPWKEGVAAALGVADPRDLWRRVLAGVSSHSDLEVPLLRAVEQLIDFVTVGGSSPI